MDRRGFMGASASHMGACAVGLVLMGALAGPLSAQDRAGLVGVVFEEGALVPIANARVTVELGAAALLTDRDGIFAFEDVPAGPLSVRVEASGYATAVEALELTPGEVSFVRLQLRPVMAILEGLRVRAGEGAQRSRGYTEHDVVAGTRNDRTAGDMLVSQVPGLSARRASGPAGPGLSIRIRGAGSMSPNSQPHIYLDGARIDGGGTGGAIQVLDQIPASMVRRIRVLRGAASATLYPGAAAGVILIETHGP